MRRQDAVAVACELAECVLGGAAFHLIGSVGIFGLGGTIGAEDAADFANGRSTAFDCQQPGGHKQPTPLGQEIPGGALVRDRQEIIRDLGKFGVALLGTLDPIWTLRARALCVPPFEIFFSTAAALLCDTCHMVCARRENAMLLPKSPAPLVARPCGPRVGQKRCRPAGLGQHREQNPCGDQPCAPPSEWCRNSATSQLRCSSLICFSNTRTVGKTARSSFRSCP